MAVQTVASHAAPAQTPLFVHLCFEAVHTPYDPVPARLAEEIREGHVLGAEALGEMRRVVAKAHAARKQGSRRRDHWGERHRRARPQWKSAWGGR